MAVGRGRAQAMVSWAREEGAPPAPVALGVRCMALAPRGGTQADWLEEERRWRPLRLFGLYRLTLAGLFSALLFTGLGPEVIGRAAPAVYAATVLAYLAFAVAAGFAIRLRWPDYDTQVLVQVLVDIVALTFLIYASGGIRSGFGMLLVVAIAGGGILTVGRTAVLFAALATIAVLIQEILAWLHFQQTAYTQAGMLGATLFATAYLAHFLAVRIRESERLAQQRGLDLANLSLLNQHIIQRMQSGILAVDAGDRVRLVNESARRLLNAPEAAMGIPLGRLSPELARQVAEWRDGRQPASILVRPERGEVDLITSFAALESSQRGSLLVFLEDSSAVTQRAQQLKLASLGRLTASIAHEIRNPLGAIGHAAQLLAESEDLGEGDRRLTRIIREHTQRVNDIIENVGQLSRRRPVAPVELDLARWVPGFLEEFAQERGLAQGAVDSAVAEGPVAVRMDPTQLRQVVTNLCENGLRYSREAPLLRLEAGVNAQTERPFLDVYDSGPGVDPEAAESLFEPFFTTEGSGTGLGLYIARELCELNQASLSHLGNTEKGHGFRISFSHPQRHGIPEP